MSDGGKVIEEATAFGQHIGPRMTDWSEDYARFELPIAPHLMNRHGVPHGGVHSSLLDTSMGHAGCYTGDPERQVFAMTLSLNVMFLSRPRGTLLIAEGRRTGGGRSTYFAEGTLKDETGELIAAGTGVFRYRKGRG